MPRKTKKQDRPEADEDAELPGRSLSFRWAAGPTQLQLALRFSMQFEKFDVMQLDPAVRQKQLLVMVAEGCADLIADMDDEPYVNKALEGAIVADDALGLTVDTLSADKLMQWAGRNMLWFKPDEQMMLKVQEAVAHGESMLSPPERRIMEGAKMTVKEFGYAYMMLVLAAASEAEGIEPAAAMSKLLNYLLEARAAKEQMDETKPMLN